MKHYFVSAALIDEDNNSGFMNFITKTDKFSISRETKLIKEQYPQFEHLVIISFQEVSEDQM